MGIGGSLVFLVFSFRYDVLFSLFDPGDGEGAGDNMSCRGRLASGGPDPEGHVYPNWSPTGIRRQSFTFSEFTSLCCLACLADASHVGGCNVNSSSSL